ncbi:hypothetical protein BD626DRAFT_435265 [Schizophyllum amplum]|uniref:MYND-type domain-containing protein n=1 Tax=Schizophyllum amplum TaxID=97359 RepID=A0A550C6Q6_9AGAR|nr:hypothetical protein BD626DRAFT_435265 [Auriculariopsis ampla]
MASKNLVQKIVHLPLEKLDKCSSCEKTSDLRLCSKCGERVYCGRECQLKDWPQHKRVCGQTDRISLQSFYPFLALLAELGRYHQDRPINRAITHEIINSPNPETPAMALEDGAFAQLVLLGNPVNPPDFATARWWPTAHTQRIRQKLQSRFLREGNLLSLIMSVSIALLSEMYSTTYVSKEASPDGKAQRRVRLSYRSSPIADFGIVKGIVDVKDQDRFAYYSVPDNNFWMGDNPNEHYWLYFRTVRGEEVTLDVGMFTYNMCLQNPSEPYRHWRMPPASQMRWAPAVFSERELQHSAPSLFLKEHNRASVLRDVALQDAIRNSADEFGDKYCRAIRRFMARLAGKEIDWDETFFTFKLSMMNMDYLKDTLVNRAWTKWPEYPSIYVDEDPGELDHMPVDAAMDDWFDSAKKWNKKYRKEKISRDDLIDAFRAYKRRGVSTI